jgi:hypothetical protein
VEVFAVEMETLCDDFIRRQYREPGPGVPGPKTPEAPEAKSPPPVTRK